MYLEIQVAFVLFEILAGVAGFALGKAVTEYNYKRKEKNE